MRMRQDKDENRPRSDAYAFQSYLLEPTVQSDARWAVIEPHQKRTFLAPGKDHLPLLFSELLSATSSSPKEGYCDELEQLGLITRSPDRSTNFPYFYSALLYDYPFIEYSDENWLANDRWLMDSYAQVTLPPPKSRELPFFEAVSQNVSTPLDALHISRDASGLDIVAAALAFATGKLGEIEASYGPWIRKTSPSGGARHPTEVTFVTTEAWRGCKAGAYYWSVETHQLKYAPLAILKERSIPYEGTYFTFSISVERPMWRYRTPRSLRPVLIDLGHVVETLRLYLEFLDIGSELVFDFGNALSVVEFINEPTICALALSSELTCRSRDTANPARSDVFCTSPLVYLRFADGCAFAASADVSNLESPLSSEMLEALHRSILSKRGDRVTYYKDLPSSLAGNLCRSRLLIGSEEARSIVKAAAKWCQSGWYVSLLWLLSGYFSEKGLHSSPLKIAIRRPGYVPEHLIKALTQRRTCRRFAQSTFDSELLFEVLQEVRTRFAFDGLKICIEARRISDLEAGIYEIDIGALPISIQKSSDRDASFDWISGQSWIEGAALTILIAAPGGNSSIQDISHLVAFGCIAQRVICMAEAYGKAAFVTPATNDDKIRRRMNLPSDTKWIFYTISLGHHG